MVTSTSTPLLVVFLVVLEHPNSSGRDVLKEAEGEHYLRLNEVTSWTEIVSIQWQAARGKERSYS